ncbi:hypothetical protein [Actinacidiphila yeochonensis]|uniref:hypothetical protein n=1 Tax=Actinacidiphila yeochonensis TaxID=89050 RepID=UPI00068F67EB|nr:hypothetical protein [Actinacidiphila yeochonensis]
MPIDPEHAPHTDPAEAAEAAAFTTALHRTADGLPAADGLSLVSAGYARGRTLRRRRAATVTAGAAVLALAGTGGVLATGAGHGAAHGGVANGPAVVAPPASSGRASGTPSPTATAAPGFTARQVEDLLVSMLPPGTISGREGRGTDSELPPYADVVFDDGHGLSSIGVSVQPDGQLPPCTQTKAGGYSCTQSHVHGGTLVVLKGYEYPDRRVDTKDWTAEFRASNGSLVTVDEWNAAAEKGAPVSRPEPPLSASRLGAIATNSTWQQVIAAMPTDVKGGLPASTVSHASTG